MDVKTISFSAAVLGTKAHKAGKKRVPCQDKEFMDFLRLLKLKVGEAIPVMNRWYEAWDGADLNANFEISFN